MKAAGILVLGKSYAAAIRAGAAALEKTRATVAAPGAHRSLRRPGFSVYAGLELLVMAAVPLAFLLWAKPLLMGFWNGLVLWWSPRLDLPIGVLKNSDPETLLWMGNAAALQPTSGISLATAIGIAVVYFASYRMSDRLLPLKFVMRALCIIQAMSLLFFILAPLDFAYSMTSHLSALLNAGYFIMLATPVLLALGWGILRVPMYQKVLYPAFFMMYFAVMVPHKVLLNALIIKHLSVLFMPVLYLCFGTIFDLMAFVALYSWLASRVPARTMFYEVAET